MQPTSAQPAPAANPLAARCSEHPEIAAVGASIGTLWGLGLLASIVASKL